jgi:hypothetical protein
MCDVSCGLVKRAAKGASMHSASKKRIVDALNELGTDLEQE